MKKYILITLLACALGFTSCAQYVPIPDSTFVTWLSGHGYSAALSGSQLDTASTLVTTATSLSCSAVPIRNLTGIQYFKALTALDCSNDSLYTIPSFPNKITNLNCQYNNLSALPAQPDSLTQLTCNYNRLTALPALPAKLTTLSCNYNNLTSLPALGNRLGSIQCDHNGLTTLPALPGSLSQFDCSYNHLTALPALPSALGGLYCDSNLITQLPLLPGSILQLDCSHNQLTALPASLPPGIQYFVCSYNQITALPAALPATITTLACDFNPIPSLPPLPAGLIVLFANNIRITSLPAALPPNLGMLFCNYDTVGTIPPLPNTVHQFTCTGCNLTSLPALPDSLSEFDCTNNPLLTCLPRFKRIVDIHLNNTGITCLPDYGYVTYWNPPLSTFPLCGIYNTTTCGIYWNISGATFFDHNGDCLMDSTDAPLPNIKIQLDSANVLIQQVVTNADGLYAFMTTKNHTYKVTVDTTTNLGLRVTCPASNMHLDTLTVADSLSFNNNFAMQCRGFDVGVQAMFSTGVPRPGTHIQLNTIAGDLTSLYGGNCSAGQSGQVQLTFTGAVTYIGPAPGALSPSLISGNTVTWTIADYATVNPLTAFNLLFAVDSNATGGATVCISANVLPFLNDANQLNNNFNYCFAIQNSQDPNEKDAYPIDTIGLNSQWLTYTIRFQNTGNAQAVNIDVVDTLNANVDPSTFQLLAYSAKNLTQIFGNRVVFNFAGINLPDSAANPTGSTGYLQYKVKLKTGVAAHTVITNRAAIYFDLNNLVLTNTIADTVVGCHANGNSYTRSICLGDVFNFNNSFLDSSGVYTDTLTNNGGCDSVVTLTLIVNATTYDSINKTLCTGDTFYLDSTHAYGRYGTYYDTVLNTLGCDSFITVVIIVDQVSLDTLNQYVCAGDSVHFGSGIYGAAGSYNDTILNLNSCPISITTLNLMVHPLPVVAFTLDSMQEAGDIKLFPTGEIWCNGWNPTTFTLTGGTPTGGNYSGNYIRNNTFYGDSIGYFNEIFDAVTYSVTDSNGCTGHFTDTLQLSSFCDGIAVIPGANLFTLYPNPADDYVMIDFNAIYTGATILVKDITGRELYTTRLTTAPQQIPTGNLPPGIYLVSMYGNGEIGTRLLVKE